MTTRPATRLPRRTLALYALPTLGLTMMNWLIMVFLLKYATDVIGVAPMIVGMLFAGGRLWDAVSDPIAGWASDGTRSRLGRRRSWMLGAALPLGLAFVALWRVPEGLGEGPAALWLGGCLLLFFTTLTAARIPYMALSAELTPDHHERTRLSAARVGAEILGLFCALAALHVVENAGSVREMAGIVAAAVGGLTILTLAVAGTGLREVEAFQGRGASNPVAGMRDVLRNPHARRLTLAVVLAELGLGSLLVAVPFITEHYGQPGTSALRILSFALPFALSVPVWIPLGRRFGKGRCYTAATGLCGLAFLLMGWAYDSLAASSACMLLIGFSQAALRTFPTSIKADIVDWDEAYTGQRKEGAYFAAWELADKAAGALSVAVVGFAIGGADGAVTGEGIQLATSTIPAALLAVATLVMLGFRLDARTHAELRARIDAGRGHADEARDAAAPRLAVLAERA